MNRSNLLPAASNEAFNVAREKNQNRFQILLDINSRPETTIYYESIQNHLTPIMCQPNKEDKYPDEIITTYASVRLSPLASDHCFVFDASLRPPKNIDQLHLKRNKRLWMLRLVASAHGHQHSFVFFFRSVVLETNCSRSPYATFRRRKQFPITIQTINNLMINWFSSQ